MVTLPSELLAEIFLISSHSFTWKIRSAPGFPTDEEIAESEDLERCDTIFNEPRLDRQPCTFTHVCKYWRKVALSTPSLWSHIKVSVGSRLNVPWDEHEQEKHFCMVSTWIKLSKGTPLMIHLDVQENLHIPMELLSTRDRWKVLYSTWRNPLEATDAQFGDFAYMLLPQCFDTVFSHPMPNLERLDILSIHCLMVEPLDLQRLPKLKYIRADFSKAVTVVHGQLHPNSRLLESLAGKWIAWDCLELLPSLPSLKTIDIELSNENVGEGSYSVTKDRKSTRLNSSHSGESRMPSSA